MKKLFLRFVCCALCAIISGCVGSINTKNVVGATANLLKATTITDAQINAMSVQFRAQEEKKYRVAASNSSYTVRLNKIMANLRSVNGIPLSYKVYLTKEVNASATADGSVRVYSGLMDVMNDNELRFVIGHEIGHVALGHTKSRMKRAYTIAALRQAGGIYSPTGVFTNSMLGNFAEAFVTAQYSQKDELEADAYGLQFLQKNSYPVEAAITCLNKLQGSGGFLSSHPSSKERVNQIQKAIKQGNL